MGDDHHRPAVVGGAAVRAAATESHVVGRSRQGLRDQLDQRRLRDVPAVLADQDAHHDVRHVGGRMV